MNKVERIYNALIKHNGRQLKPDSCRLEIDLSVLLELFALEDYIKELEDTITKQEAIIVGKDIDLSLANKEKYLKLYNKRKKAKKYGRKKDI